MVEVVIKVKTVTTAAVLIFEFFCFKTLNIKTLNNTHDCKKKKKKRKRICRQKKRLRRMRRRALASAALASEWTHRATTRRTLFSSASLCAFSPSSVAATISTDASDEDDNLYPSSSWPRKEVVVGLEIHLQLTRLKAKLFSPARNFGEVNTVHAFDRAEPGTLPSPVNERAVACAVKLGVALNAKCERVSEFDRKHYFYGDLPHGYQITQHRKPILTGGRINDGVRVERVQLEMDTGKTSTSTVSSDDGGTQTNKKTVTNVDLSRAGSTLLEIVTRPDIRSEEQAVETVSDVIQMARYLEISDANMEDGSIRVDVNVSVRNVRKNEGESFDDDDDFRNVNADSSERTEIKNLNSLRSIRNAIKYEKERHGRYLDGIAGAEKVERETRSWDEKLNRTIVLRSKESLLDYRFMKEPDVLPIVLTDEEIERAKNSVGEMPKVAFERLKNLGISEEHAKFLSLHPSSVKYFDDIVSLCLDASMFSSSLSNEDAKSVANFVCVEIVGALREAGVSTKGKPPFQGIESKTNLHPERVRDVLKSLKVDKTISGRMAKDVLKVLARNDTRSIDEIIEQDLGGSLISSQENGDGAQNEAATDNKDSQSLDAMCESVVEDLVDEREAMRKNPKVFGAFVGEVMKRTRGRADPKQVSATLRKLLDEY